MHFVDEENLSRLYRAQDSGKVKLFLQHRAGGLRERDVQLQRNNRREPSSCPCRAARREARDPSLRLRAWRAASMAICRFSLSRACPVKSASRRGRSPVSNWKVVFREDDAETRRSSAISARAPAPCGTAARTHPALRLRALSGPRSLPQVARSPDSATPTSRPHQSTKARAQPTLPARPP